MANPLAHERVLAFALVLLASATACEKRAELEKLSTTMIQASAGTAAKSPMRNVIPSKPAKLRLNLVVEEERYLGDVARQLGASVDSLLALNQLRDTLLQKGQILLVETSREMLDQFVDRREKRKAAKIAAEEAKRQDKLRKEAELRAAKRMKLMEARAKKRGGKVSLAAMQAGHDKGPTGVPLRAGEVRQLGHGQIQGVHLPAGIGGK